MTTAQLINQTSGDTEWYTPTPIIEAARMTLGSIELDPASSDKANEVVQAKRYFTKEINGLGRDWSCDTIWMNHPFGRTTNVPWVGRLLAAWVGKEIRVAACCITYACTSESWFRPLMDYPQCFLSPRTNYRLPDGSIMRGVTKGSVVTYLGRDLERFRKFFNPLGKVKV